MSPPIPNAPTPIYIPVILVPEVGRVQAGVVVTVIDDLLGLSVKDTCTKEGRVDCV